MNHEQEINNLRNQYRKYKKEGEQESKLFLDSIVSYCRYIGFDKDKTKCFLALIIGVIPNTGQSFTDCRCYDEEEKIFMKEFMEKNT